MAAVPPGDVLTVYHESVATRPSESMPDAGIIEVEIVAENDAGERVIEDGTAGVVKRRRSRTD